MKYHIILTERCNLKCKYCYEKSMKEFENGLEKKWKYDDKASFDSQVNINELKKFLKSTDTLIFYGGEPLIKIDKIKAIIDNIDCRFCMQTNGLFLDQLPINYFKKIDKILISIDGNKKRDDENKGKGHYDKVLENIKKIRKEGYTGEIVARMALSKPDLYNQVLHLTTLIDQGIFDSVHWQIDAEFYKFDYDKNKFSKFVREYNVSLTKLINYWISEMKNGKVRKYYPFLGFFDIIYYNRKTKLQCGAGYENFTINTKGDLSACPIMNSVKDFYCGSIKTGIKKNISCKNWCTDCKDLDICGGRCLYANYAQLWPKEGHDLVCLTIKHLIKEIKKNLPKIKLLIEKKKISEKDFEFEKYFGPEIVP